MEKHTTTEFVENRREQMGVTPIKKDLTKVIELYKLALAVYEDEDADSFPPLDIDDIFDANAKDPLEVKYLSGSLINILRLHTTNNELASNHFKLPFGYIVKNKASVGSGLLMMFELITETPVDDDLKRRVIEHKGTLTPLEIDQLGQQLMYTVITLFRK